MFNEARAVTDRKRRRPEEEKAELIERWCESGLSRAEFCRRERICYGSFLNWITQWIGEEVPEPEAAVEFLQVITAAPVQGTSEADGGVIEILAPNGWRVRVKAGFDSQDLHRVVEVLGRW